MSKQKTFQPDLDLFQTGCRGPTGKISFEVNLFDRFRFVAVEDTRAHLVCNIHIALLRHTFHLPPAPWLAVNDSYLLNKEFLRSSLNYYAHQTWIS